MSKCGEVLKQHTDEIAKLVTLETGKVQELINHHHIDLHHHKAQPLWPKEYKIPRENCFTDQFGS